MNGLPCRPAWRARGGGGFGRPRRRLPRRLPRRQRRARLDTAERSPSARRLRVGNEAAASYVAGQ